MDVRPGQRGRRGHEEQYAARGLKTEKRLKWPRHDPKKPDAGIAHGHVNEGRLRETE
jgi:hypothetical protein